MASYAINLLRPLAPSKSRVDSFDGADSFDVVSLDESIEECIEMQEEAEGWEDLTTASHGDDMEQDAEDVHIEMADGFEHSIQAALQSSVLSGSDAAAQAIRSPRWRSAREALRAFYLSRAKTSEESSKNYRSYVPEKTKEPVAIAPLRAQERYDVELYERATRLENARKAELALRDFYAKRDAAKAKRAAENRANERFVYQSQIGSSASCIQPLHWETTRFVIHTNGLLDATVST